MSLNKLYFDTLKRDFMKEKQPDLEALGYRMACEISLLERKIHLVVRLQPLPGSPDPIDEGSLTKIKEEILGDNYNGFPLDIQYIGVISPRKE